MHDKAYPIKLDTIAHKELAHIRCSGFEWDALHFEDALTAKTKRQSRLHLFAGYLEWCS